MKDAAKMLSLIGAVGVVGVGSCYLVTFHPGPHTGHQGSKGSQLLEEQNYEKN